MDKPFQIPFEMNTGLFFKSLVVLGLINANCAQNKSLEYNIENPDQKIELPEILQEVSGITELDSTHVVCVQDENGILFVLDINTGEITKQFTFGEDGDYEGITRVGNTIYILRSDGILIELSGWDSGNVKSHTYNTNIPAKNNEGLCYDPANDRLLIGCKSKPGQGAEFKDVRSIYAFDLNTKKLGDHPVYEFNVSEIADSVRARGINLPTKTKKKTGEEVENFKFGISAIAIHPDSGDLYMLAAIDYLYLIFDSNGNIKAIKQLPKNLYPQAEGITFLKNGNMIITSEGVDGNAQLFVISQY